MVKTIPGMKPLVNSSGAEVQCIPELVIESVNQTDVDLHKELLSGVILTGVVHISPVRIRSSVFVYAFRSTSALFMHCLSTSVC